MPNIEITKPELIWPGKYDAEGNRIIDRGVALPFQVVETIREGRATREPGHVADLFSAKPSSHDEWRNKLIWGDNLLVMASLMEEFAGKVDLVYIDPPFATGADFSFKTTIGDTGVQVGKEASIIEQKAYHDTWGAGVASFLQMLYERLHLAYQMLSDRGSFYIHLEPDTGNFIRPILDEIFGSSGLRTEIAWKRTSSHGNVSRNFGEIWECIFYYTKSTDEWTWNQQYVPFDQKYIDSHFTGRDPDGRQWTTSDLVNPGVRPNLRYEYKGYKPHQNGWKVSRERMEELDNQGRLYFPEDRSGRIRLKRYLDETPGQIAQNLWLDISPINSQAAEALGYATQKPEALLDRVVKTSSSEGDLVLDFFCGSGTTLAVAEKLNRRWIGCDLGRFAIHTTRKRLLGIPGCKPFEILNLGKYERKHWQGVTFGDERPAEPDQAAVAAYVRFILDLYHAQPLPGTHIHGRKGGSLVHVGAVDAPVTIAQINAALAETEALGQHELHVLGWEWEMGMSDPLVQQAKQAHGVRLRLLNIPREVMERQAVDRGDMRFFDLAHLEAEIVALTLGPSPASGRGGNKVEVRLTDFVIPDTDLIPDEVRAKIRKWSDYIDYWAVDWDFQHDTFMNQWQAYRTRKVRKLDLESGEHEYPGPGTYRVLVKVVDIFGNDTSRLLTWEAR